VDSDLEPVQNYLIKYISRKKKINIKEKGITIINEKERGKT